MQSKGPFPDLAWRARNIIVFVYTLYTAYVCVRALIVRWQSRVIPSLVAGGKAKRSIRRGGRLNSVSGKGWLLWTRE